MTGVPRPDYERQGLEIFDTPTYEVYDPWSAQIRGVFYTKEDADLFVAAILAVDGDPENEEQ